EPRPMRDGPPRADRSVEIVSQESRSVSNRPGLMPIPHGETVQRLLGDLTMEVSGVTMSLAVMTAAMIVVTISVVMTISAATNRLASSLRLTPLKRGSVERNLQSCPHHRTPMILDRVAGGDEQGARPGSGGQNATSPPDRQGLRGPPPSRNSIGRRDPPPPRNTGGGSADSGNWRK
uniref:Uncharacterized protein n=1 Tax=Caenorhabditis japonica TaxID=281687 RepID=A0A8R1ELS0_CAEJA